MQRCKVCNQEFKEVNKSHVRAKHDLTWDEYQRYGVIQLEENGKPVENIWSSVNIEAIEFKVRYREMRHNLVEIRDRECVDLRQGKNCFGCLNPISELAVYVILSSSNETRFKEPEFMKKPHHLDCAVARAHRGSLIGMVMNPIDMTKETNIAK